MAETKVTPNETRGAYTLNIVGSDHSPLPTSEADSPSSSMTFTLAQASTLKITFGCMVQQNTALTSYIRLNIDGSNVKEIRTTNAYSGQVYLEQTKTFITNLSAGSHTIKLRGVSTVGSAVVNINPYWIAEVTSQ